MWRRSYSSPPEPMEDTHPYYHQVPLLRWSAGGVVVWCSMVVTRSDAQICGQPWFTLVPSGARPRTEALSDLVARTVPFWRDQVEQTIKQG